jgi:hypothetical protein
MTTTQPATVTIEHLDFDPALPCESSEHPELHVPAEAAAYLVRPRCSRCGNQPVDFLLCASGWDVFGARGCHCRSCDANDMPRDECMTILRVLDSRAA